MAYNFNAFNVYRSRVTQAINDEISTSAAQVGRWIVAQDERLRLAFRNGREALDVALEVIEHGDDGRIKKSEYDGCDV